MYLCVWVSGLKPGQRKVLFTCLKRNDKREVKVAQLAGSVAEMSAYHHGEVCLTFSTFKKLLFFTLMEKGLIIIHSFCHGLAFLLELNVPTQHVLGQL